MRSKFDFPSNLIKLVLGPAAPVPLSLLLHHSYSESVLYFARRVDTGPGWDQDDGHLHNSRRWGTADTARAANTERGNLVKIACDMI